MFKYLVIFLVIQISSSYLKVYGPQCAATRMPKNIEYTLSNFGDIPYGQTMIGQIRLPNQAQLCKIQGQPLSIKNKGQNTQDILLVKRGGCKFTQKVINAQNLGADIIIIYNDIQGEGANVVMKNDGHGHLAQIPSLFIGNFDGRELMKTSKQCKDIPLVKLQFEIDQKQTSQVTLWLDANNRETYILARDFHKNGYYKAIKNRIELSIRFRVQNNCENWICEENDCIKSKTSQKYCRTATKSDDSSSQTVKGVDLIKEQMRQYYLWEEIKSTDQKLKWWKYMDKFDKQDCLEYKDVEDCSYSVMKDQEIQDTIISNIKANVAQAQTDLKQNKTNIIRQSYQESKEMSIFFYPQVTINNRNFYGLFKAPQVFEFICSSLIDPPKECISFSKQTGQIEASGTWKTILIIIGVMSASFLIALIIYTRIIRREINQQLSVEVSKMVENYVNLANKKGGSTSNSYSKFQS